MWYRGKDSLCQVHRSRNGRWISGPFGRLGGRFSPPRRGAVARGEAVETSDVDLLVAPGPGTTLFDSAVLRLTLKRSSRVMWMWPRRVA
jgi:hypothetical protein